MGRVKTRLWKVLTVAGASTLAVAWSCAPSWAGVSHATGDVNGVNCEIWKWTDSTGHARTVALKKEGAGNPGHGGYAVQMTYFAKFAGRASEKEYWGKVTVDADVSGRVDSADGDGGFGYFVSHERYRYFGIDKDGAENWRSIASLFPDGPHPIDSPLGRSLAAITSEPMLNGKGSVGAQSFTVDYGHYGTTRPVKIDANSGKETPPLTDDAYNSTNYHYYTIPVTTTWVFQDGFDYPRIDVSVDFSKIIPPGAAAPTPNLVSFDVRGPYGVMVFDDGVDGPIDRVLWGDQQFVFQAGATTRSNAWDYILSSATVTRSSAWDWSAPNKGARYNGLTAKGRTRGMFEMGLFEPVPASKSALADGYSPERGFTSRTYAAAVANLERGLGPSVASCLGISAQMLPSDATWPYQSIQYSLPCRGLNYLTAPAITKKLAWGSSNYYGMNLPNVFNGVGTWPISGWPPGGKLNYSVCLVLAWNPDVLQDARTRGPGPATNSAAGLETSLTRAAAAYANSGPLNPNCAIECVPEELTHLTDILH